MHDSMEHPKPQTADKDTGRLEAFSDGVFSIAMTLLVLELKVPPRPDHPTAAALWTALGAYWPSYFAFVTSFATVLIMWMNHHGIFRLVRKCSGGLLFANGFLLLLVTAVPWPTALVATYLRTPAASVACIVYAGLFVIISISYAWILIAAKRGGHLLMPGALHEVDCRLRSCIRVGTPLYLLAALAAVYSPWLSLGICSVLWVYWAIVGMYSGQAFTV